MAREALDRGHRAYARRAWAEAYAALVCAYETEPLGGEDLDRLGLAAFMLGRDDDSIAWLQRAHRTHAARGDGSAAARSAFWAGMQLMLRGELGPGSGWLARADRVLGGADAVERGYLLIPHVFRLADAGELDGAIALARDAARIAERFGDRDLFALAVHQEGRLHVEAGRLDEGLPLLDEAMLAGTAGELSPIVTGIVYCAVILACQSVLEVRRAREWTHALSAWCAEQPEMLAFTGRCLVHRAEILQLEGAWADALAEAERAARRALETESRAGSVAQYRRGELLRLRGSFAEAEEAYAEAARLGAEPQPGLALLRLAQGRPSAAAAAIRRAEAAATSPLDRAALLPALVEIALAVGEREEAARASEELASIAGRYGSAMLGATGAHARGAVALAAGDARAALVALREAGEAWHALRAPYDAARTRVLVGLACRALGDEETAAAELAAARAAFEQLGAGPDAARAEALGSRVDAHGLSPRQLEVLRLVAAGRSNREIAAELVISEHTVARHVQNIFAKLRLSSRTAAAAFAFEHDLVRGGRRGPK